MPHNYNLIEVIALTIGGLWMMGFMTAIMAKKPGDYLKKTGNLAKVFKNQWKIFVGILLGYVAMRESGHSTNTIILVAALVLLVWLISLGVSIFMQKHQDFLNWTGNQFKKHWGILAGIIIGLYCSTITITFL